MSKDFVIREYVDDYIKFFPEKWSWELKSTPEQKDLYMCTRARRGKDHHKNYDLLPDFNSIERDAAQFGLSNVEWTDFFGLVWKGQKGINAYVGAPNYEGSLYYYNTDEEYDDSGFCVSSEYDAYKHQPPIEIYTRVNQHGVNHWIDTLNVIDARYKYIVDNHLFKDTHIDLIYEDGEIITVYSEYRDLINGLLRHGKDELVKKIFETMNGHFIKLRDSKQEDERRFYPDKTAEEMFGQIESNSEN